MCMYGASLAEPAEVRNTPLCGFDDGLWAAEANAKRKLDHRVLCDRCRHTSRYCSTKPINVLIWVSDSNDTVFDESCKQCMIGRGLVLIFIDHDSWKLWECSSEQCGHVNLIIEIDEPKIRTSDRLTEKLVEEFNGIFIGALVHCKGEVMGGD